MRVALMLLSLLSLPVLAAVQVIDPYVRVLPPGSPNTAAFMQLTNAGTNELALVAVETEIAARAELHTHQLVDGVAQMRQVAEIALPAGQMVSLQPGGLHIMLLDLKAPLKADEPVALTLIFSDGSRQPVTAIARELVASKAHHHH